MRGSLVAAAVKTNCERIAIELVDAELHGALAFAFLDVGVHGLGILAGIELLCSRLDERAAALDFEPVALERDRLDLIALLSPGRLGAVLFGPDEMPGAL